MKLYVALALAFTVSCHSSSHGAPDAAASARPKIVRPRVLSSGEMPLDLAASRLSLTIMKDHVTPVPATLAMRDGALALDAAPPRARLSVDLDTFESGIAIRNERVRNIFFETSALGWESAEVAFELPSELVARVRAEKRVSRVELAGTLKVHGATTRLAVVVDAGFDGAKLWLKSASPVEVKISDLGLTDNLRRLNAICMHDGVDDVVKVDVSLVFTPTSP